MVLDLSTHFEALMLLHHLCAIVVSSILRCAVAMPAILTRHRYISNAGGNYLLFIECLAQITNPVQARFALVMADGRMLLDPVAAGQAAWIHVGVPCTVPAAGSAVCAGARHCDVSLLHPTGSCIPGLID